MRKTIYLDMDGVLANFMDTYVESKQTLLFGSAEYKESWAGFSKLVMHHDLFTRLDHMPLFRKLINLVESFDDVRIEVLTSSGDRSGKAHHDHAKYQKSIWLASRGLSYELNIVPCRKLKAEYAHADAFLIDDHPENVEEFIKSGGHAFLYTEDRFDELENYLRAFFDVPTQV